MNKTYERMKRGDCFICKNGCRWLKVNNDISITTKWFILSGEDFDEDEILTPIPMEDFIKEWESNGGRKFEMPDADF